MHILLFSILAFLLFRAFYRDREFNPLKSGLFAFILTSLYGALDEFHQYFTPLRNVDFFDWLGDTIGAAAVFIGALYFDAKRKP